MLLQCRMKSSRLIRSWGYSRKCSVKILYLSWTNLAANFAFPAPGVFSILLKYLVSLRNTLAQAQSIFKDIFLVLLEGMAYLDTVKRLLLSWRSGYLISKSLNEMFFSSLLSALFSLANWSNRSYISRQNTLGSRHSWDALLLQYFFIHITKQYKVWIVDHHFPT